MSFLKSMQEIRKQTQTDITCCREGYLEPKPDWRESEDSEPQDSSLGSRKDKYLSNAGSN